MESNPNKNDSDITDYTKIYDNFLKNDPKLKKSKKESDKDNNSLSKNILENNIIDKLKLENNIIDKISEKNIFDQVITNYNMITNNIDNIEKDIKKLEAIHTDFINNIENKLTFREYGSYIDDIYYQIKIQKIEKNNLIKIQYSNINKLYQDFFRLYCKIIKKILDLDSLKDKNNYFNKIKIFKEVNIENYTITDCKNIYSEIQNKLGEFVQYSDNIKDLITNVQEHKNDGFLLHTYLISLGGEKNKMITLYSMYSKILESILNLHINISTKYVNRSNMLANEIINDNEKIDINK